MTTIGAALASGRRRLAASGSATAALDTRLLLGAAAGLDTAALMARQDDELAPVAERCFETYIGRREGSEPVARILGAQEFWGLPFEVSEETLIPRADTETLVESVLAAAPRLGPAPRFCDLGTGTGAVSIAILSELRDAHAVATDLSEAALATARRNADRLGVADRVEFRREDLAVGPQGPFDAVVSNPPYVETAAIEALQPEVRDHEPVLALDGGPDGLDCFRAIVARAPAMLRPGGLLALEVGWNQSEAVAGICREGGLGEVAIRRDLAGIGRVVTAFRPPPALEGAQKPLGIARRSG